MIMRPYLFNGNILPAFASLYTCHWYHIRTSKRSEVLDSDQLHEIQTRTRAYISRTAFAGHWKIGDISSYNETRRADRRC